MAKVEISIPQNPYIVTLPNAADVHELHFGSQITRGIGLNSGPVAEEWNGAPIVAQLSQEKIGLAKIKVLGAASIKFGVGSDPSTNPWSVVAADGFVEISFRHNISNIWCKAAGAAAQFQIMVQTA